MSRRNRKQELKRKHEHAKRLRAHNSAMLAQASSNGTPSSIGTRIRLTSKPAGGGTFFGRQ